MKKAASRHEELGLVLRWIFVVGLAVLVAQGGAVTLELGAVFAVAVLWSLALSFKEELGLRLLEPEWVQLLGDALIGASLFFFSGTLLGPLVWAGLLPVVNIALSSGISGGLLAGLVSSALFGLVALVDISVVEISNLMRTPALVFVLAGFAMGALSQRLAAAVPAAEPTGQGDPATSGVKSPASFEETDTQPSMSHFATPKAQMTERQQMEQVAAESRKQLARRMHDGAIQSVAAIAMRVNLARRMLDRDVEAADLEMQKVEELARRSTKEIRHLLFTMAPQSLEASGLVAALRDLAEQTEDAYGQVVGLETDKKAVEGMATARQQELFFVGLEGLLNATAHAKAEHIELRLSRGTKGIAILEVEDDGQGFDVPRHSSTGQGGWGEIQSGLQIARARAALLGGSLELDSERGRGTRYIVRVPIVAE